MKVELELLAVATSLLLGAVWHIQVSAAGAAVVEGSVLESMWCITTTCLLPCYWLGLVRCSSQSKNKTCSQCDVWNSLTGEVLGSLETERVRTQQCSEKIKANDIILSRVLPFSWAEFNVSWLTKLSWAYISFGNWSAYFKNQWHVKFSMKEASERGKTEEERKQPFLLPCFDCITFKIFLRCMVMPFININCWPSSSHLNHGAVRTVKT